MASHRNRSKPNRLFQQQAEGTFREVAAAAGVDDPGFGHGVAVGDIDNERLVDIYVTNYGSIGCIEMRGRESFVMLPSRRELVVTPGLPGKVVERPRTQRPIGVSLSAAIVRKLIAQETFNTARMRPGGCGFMA